MMRKYIFILISIVFISCKESDNSFSDSLKVKGKLLDSISGSWNARYLLQLDSSYFPLDFAFISQDYLQLESLVWYTEEYLPFGMYFKSKIYHAKVLSKNLDSNSIEFISTDYISSIKVYREIINYKYVDTVIIDTISVKGTLRMFSNNYMLIDLIPINKKDMGVFGNRYRLFR